MWVGLIFFDLIMTKKRIKKCIALPDSKEGQYMHIVLKYKVLTDVIKVRIKYYYDNRKLEIKAITGAVKNPNFCRIISPINLANELNSYLEKYTDFDSKLTGDMIETQLVKQGLLYPF